MPAVSVILPVYNGAATLAETLQSVFAQTWTDFEAIVVDDGSTDDSAAIARAIAGPRLRVASYANAGVSAARNRGAKLATGRYLTFLDADDRWAPDKLEAQVRALEANPNAAVAHSWVDCTDDRGAFLRRGGYLTVTAEPYLQLLLIDLVESGSNVMVRREAFEAVDGFDETLTHSEDWDLWIRLAARFDFVTVPAPQVFYRQAAGTASANVWKMEAASRQILDREARKLPPERQNVIRESWANRYKILTFEALDAPPDRRRAWAALRYLRQVVRLDPAVARQRKPLLKLGLKILAILLLPRDRAKAVIAKVPDAAAIETFLLGTIQVNVPPPLPPPES